MNFSKRWRISCFINGFGKLPAQFARIENQAEKYAFLQKHFGRIGLEVLHAQQSAQQTAKPLGWLSRIDNFMINLFDWRA